MTYEFDVFALMGNDSTFTHDSGPGIPIYTPTDPEAESHTSSSVSALCNSVRENLEDLETHQWVESDIQDLSQMCSRMQESITWIREIIQASESSSDEDAVEQELGVGSRATTPELSASLLAPTPTDDAPTVLEVPSTTVQQSTSEGAPFALVTNLRRARRKRQPQAKHQPPSKGPLSSKRPSTRLIVRFPGQPVPPDVRPHPTNFRNALNEALQMPAVDSIQYTRNGQLVLHTRAPHTAAQLALLSDQMWPVIQTALQMGDTPRRPAFEPDDAWTRIVIHNVPVPIWDGKADHDTTHKNIIRDLYAANALPAHSVQQARWLCHKEEAQRRVTSSTPTSPTFVTLMLAILDTDVAAKLRHTGVTASGAHCKVSGYRRPKSAESRRQS